jgi:hypothetical protein
LQHQEPSRHYGWHLVRNTKLAFEACEKALDPHGMNLFIEQGHLLRRHGGIFEFNIDAYSRVSTVFRQTRRNRLYLEAYGDYISCDGTHLVDKFGNLLLLMTVVDCLGISQCGGSVVAPAESADVIIEGLRLFGAGVGSTKEGRTFHTDGGTWGPVVAAAMGRTHLLCTNHFATKKVCCFLILTGSD